MHRLCFTFPVTFLGRPLTVRPVLSDHCLTCPVCDVGVCVQTVGRIKMKLGMRVGLGSGHTVLDGDPGPPPPKGHNLL